MLCATLFGEHKTIGLPMVIAGLAMLIYVFAKAARSIPSFKMVSSLQSRHLLLAAAWGLLFGFSVALFLVGNMIILAAPK